MLADGLVTWKDSALASVKACHRRGGLNSRRVLSQFWKLDVQHQSVLAGFGEAYFSAGRWLRFRHVLTWPLLCGDRDSLGDTSPIGWGPTLVTSFGPYLWRLGLHGGIWGNVTQFMAHCADHRPLCRRLSHPGQSPGLHVHNLIISGNYLRAAVHVWAGSLLPGQFSEGEEITAWVAAGFPYC